MKTLEETYRGEPTIAVTVQIPKSLYILARRSQIALQFETWGYENFHNYIVAAICTIAEGDTHFLEGYYNNRIDLLSDKDLDELKRLKALGCGDRLTTGERSELKLSRVGDVRKGEVFTRIEEMRRNNDAEREEREELADELRRACDQRVLEGLPSEG
jgi:hypothetical protein